MKSFLAWTAEQTALVGHVLSLLAGMSGGCYIAAFAYIRGRRITRYLLAAYMIIGGLSALGSGIAIRLLLGAELSWERSFLVGGVVGIIAVLSVAGFNFRASLKIPYTGQRLDISIGEDRKNE